MDENYVTESILQPMAKVRAGFAPVMPPYQGRAKEKHIKAVIEYMKTLK
jgi:cytochrome c oxidase subunit 2